MTNNKRLGKQFFIQPTLKVAKDLLGKYLVRKIGNKKISGKIVETEAYIGPYDKASHAFNFKKTKRNQVEYLAGGYIYIYLVYGMHWQLNIVTYLKEKPECVLIRAIEPVSNFKFQNSNLKLKDLSLKLKTHNLKVKNLTNGPGKLCRYLKLNKTFYGEDLTKSKRIWLEDRGEKIKLRNIKNAPRIGINYAGSYWLKKKWRFYIKNNQFVSKK